MLIKILVFKPPTGYRDRQIQIIIIRKDEQNNVKTEWEKNMWVIARLDNWERAKGAECHGGGGFREYRCFSSMQY